MNNWVSLDLHMNNAADWAKYSLIILGHSFHGASGCLTTAAGRSMNARNTLALLAHFPMGTVRFECGTLSKEEAVSLTRAFQNAGLAAGHAAGKFADKLAAV